VDPRRSALRRVGGAVAVAVIHIEAGLSKCDMIRTPPDFCASAIGAASANDNANAAANPRRFRPTADTSQAVAPFSSSGSFSGALVAGATATGYTAADPEAIPATGSLSDEILYLCHP
jgi:hypothetical protein